MKKILLGLVVFASFSASAQILMRSGVVYDTTYLHTTLVNNTSAVATKEPIITASNTASGYYNGFKQFRTLSSDSSVEGATNLFYTAARSALVLKYTDTSTMLSAYRTAINSTNTNTATNTTNIATGVTNTNLRVKYTDTASMLSAYGAATLLRVNYTDTASMLSNYKSAISSLQTSSAAIVTSTQVLVASSAQTTFTFTSVPTSSSDFVIYRNGIALEPTTDYTYSGNVVTISAAVVNDRVRFQRTR